MKEIREEGLRDISIPEIGVKLEDNQRELEMQAQRENVTERTETAETAERQAQDHPKTPGRPTTKGKPRAKRKTSKKSDALHIVSLEAENVKRLKAVRIEPDGSLVIVGGRNEQGKSSLIDSIEMALGGEKSICPKPIRVGEEKAMIVADLGEMVVERTFTDKGTYLRVRNAEGHQFSSPQKILDSLVDGKKLAFDPLKFAQMSGAELASALKEILDLDFEDIDQKHRELYDERRDLNRDLKSKKDELKRMGITRGGQGTRLQDIPDEEVSVSSLSEELERINAHNQKLVDVGKEVDDTTEALSQTETEIGGIKDHIDQLEEQLATKEKLRKIQKKAIAREEERLEKLGDELDPEPVREKISQADEINQRVRDKKRWHEVGAEVREITARSDGASLAMGQLVAEKAGMIEAAEFPVDSLEFDGESVVLDGVPFEQASTARKIRVSVAMGLAANPRLRVLLIREGSHLDEDAMRELAEIAEQHDAQVWIERVTKDEECSIIIEDGEAVEVES